MTMSKPRGNPGAFGLPCQIHEVIRRRSTHVAHCEKLENFIEFENILRSTGYK